MFRAKLIQDKAYYALRRKQYLYWLLPALPVAILANFYHIPLWLALFGLIAYVTIMFYGIRNSKRLQALANQHIIEMDSQEIRIKTKNKPETVYPIISLTEIRVKDRYGIPGEEVKDFTKEIKGDALKNYVFIQTNDQELRFDFELDSQYMIGQLERVIAQWKQNGLHVVTDPLSH